MSGPNTDSWKQVLEQVLQSALAQADKLDLPLVAIRISEAIDELSIVHTNHDSRVEEAIFSNG